VPTVGGMSDNTAGEFTIMPDLAGFGKKLAAHVEDVRELAGPPTQRQAEDALLLAWHPAPSLDIGLGADEKGECLAALDRIERLADPP
jgi:hypothetical protein